MPQPQVVMLSGSYCITNGGRTSRTATQDSPSTGMNVLGRVMYVLVERVSGHSVPKQHGGLSVLRRIGIRLQSGSLYSGIFQGLWG